MPSLGRLGADVVDALYPSRCALCGEASAPSAAEACARHALPDPGRGPRGARCDRCARALPPALPDGTRCAACRRRPPRFRRVVALGDYRADEALRAWVLALKHGGRRDLAPPLGRALARRLRAAFGGRALLVPVPLHPLRRLERGYDQARALARAGGRGARGQLAAAPRPAALDPAPGRPGRAVASGQRAGARSRPATASRPT